MITPEIISYIKSQLASGIARDSISINLVKSGWQIQDIEEAFNSITTPITVNSASPVFTTAPNTIIVAKKASVLGRLFFWFFTLIFISMVVGAGYIFYGLFLNHGALVSPLCSILKSDSVLGINLKDSLVVKYTLGQFVNKISPGACGLDPNTGIILPVINSDNNQTSQEDNSIFDQTLNSLTPGVMSDGEINTYLNDLKMTSYLAEYDFSTLNGSTNMSQDIKTALQYNNSSLSIKYRTTNDMDFNGKSVTADVVIEGILDKNGDITKFNRADVCMLGATGIPPICMNQTAYMDTTLTQLKNNPSFIEGKNIFKNSQKEYLGTKEILGVKAKCFKVTSNLNQNGITKTYIQNVCYHPNYPIIMEVKANNNGSKTSMLIKSLEIKDMPDSYFNITN